MTSSSVGHRGEALVQVRLEAQVVARNRAQPAFAQPGVRERLPQVLFAPRTRAQHA
jgi:hypothetical protein